MLRDVAVGNVMTTEVLSFTVDQNVQEAMQQLVDRDVDAGPVIDDAGRVVGLLSTGDLIVEEARVHFPTVVNFLGVNVTLPFSERKLDEAMEKALGATVGEVMTSDVHTIGPEETVEDAATLMHDHDVSRLPVVDEGGVLVGLIARGDIVRAIVIGMEDAPGGVVQGDAESGGEVV
jgi:CBS domain-containing protein